MSKKLVDMLSDESEMEIRVGCMKGVSHIFEKQSRPSLQQRIFRRRTNFSDNTDNEYYHVSSDDIQPIARRKASLPIKKICRTASFDASNAPRASLLGQGFSSHMQHSFESEEILQSSLFSGSPLYFQNSPTAYSKKGQKAIAHSKISSFEFDDEVINRLFGEEPKESAGYKGRQTHFSDFREVAEGAFASPIDDQSTKTSDECRNPSSQTFDSDGFQKHIQESNDLVSSWLGCRERAIDDLKESLRLLGKLKDQEFNKVNSKLTSQHPLDFQKTSQYTQRGASRHAIEERLQEISHVDSRAPIKIGKKAKESSRHVQGTREGNGYSVDSKGLGSDFQKRKEPSRILLEGRKSILPTPGPEISAKTGLYNREISRMVPERMNDLKGKYDSYSQGHDNSMVSEIVINVEKHKRAPNVIARLMGLDAMHDTKGLALPQPEKRPTSDAALQQEALYNKPQKETSKKQVPKKEKDVQNLSSQAKYEILIGETVERSKCIQSVEDGKTRNKAFSKPQSMETTTHLEMFSGQKHTEDPNYVTCKQQEEIHNSVAAPRYTTNSTIKFSQKVNDLGNVTLQKTPHEHRQSEAHVEHQKPQNQNCASIERQGLDEEMEARFRQLRLQNALDEHKTLREILETMQLKGLLHSPQSKKIQEIQHQKSIDEVSRTKPEHENVGSKIKDLTSKDLPVDKQEIPTNVGYKRHHISSTGSLSDSLYDKRNFKEAAIVLIKPISGLEASKFIAPSHDPSEMKNSRSRLVAASFKTGTEQGQRLESKKNSKKKVNGNCETNKISKNRKISVLFVNADDSQTTENDGLQNQDSEPLEKGEELSPAPPIFQLLDSMPKQQFLGKDQNIGGTDSVDLVRNFKSAENMTPEAMQNSESLGKAYHKFSGKKVSANLEERFLRETNLQHDGVTPCDIRLPIISHDVNTPSFKETALDDHPSAPLGKGDRHKENRREIHPERERKPSGDPRELSNSQKMDVIRLFLSDLSEISNKLQELNIVEGIGDNVQTKLVEAKATTSEMQNEITQSSKSIQDELESEFIKDKERTLGKHIHATNSSDKRLHILNIEEDPAKDLLDEHATKWQPAEAFPMDAGRPTPISVLDIHFQKDELAHTNASLSTTKSEDSTTQSPLTSSSCNRSLDFNFQRHVDKVLQEVEPLQDLTGTVYATFQTDVPHYPKGVDKRDQSQESLSVTDSGRFQWQDDGMASIKDILEISGFAEMSPLLTQCQPLNPAIEQRRHQSMNKVTIRDYLKKDEASKIDEMAKKAMEIADRRLHFECVNEIIAKNLLPFVDLHPWFSLSQPILQKRPPGDELVQQAWKELRELPCLPIEDACDMLHILLEQDLVQTPSRWSDLKAETAEVGLHLANLIFEDAVADMIYDLVVLTTARKLS